MNVEKMVEVGLLFEQYKNLLTQKQKEVVSLYYEEDLSLGEISEILGVSRQGVYDNLKRSEKILNDYEEKIHLLSTLKDFDENLKKIQEILEDIKMNLQQNSISEYLFPKLEEIDIICKGLIK
ncbi:MAG: YlxM family DNA-binding protein [Clostridioides sp.]|jgi:predicted DNA-binding protein YlxM (UPF0122 family)|nr:YlxM family DNA-binding protein [Clostridioides sp.]